MIKNADLEDCQNRTNARQYVMKSDILETVPLLRENSKDILRSPSSSLLAKDEPNVSLYHLGSIFWYFPLHYSFAFVIYVGYLLIKTAVLRVINFVPELKQSLMNWILLCYLPVSSIYSDFQKTDELVEVEISATIYPLDIIIYVHTLHRPIARVAKNCWDQSTRKY